MLISSVFIYNSNQLWFETSGTWTVIGSASPNVSKNYSAFVFTVQQCRRHQNPSKHHKLLTQWHNVTTQKTGIFRNTTVRTWNLTQQQCSLWCRHPIVPSTNLFTFHVHAAVHLDVFHYNLESMCYTTPLRSLFCMQNSFHWYKYWQNASSKLQPSDTEQGARIACMHCVCAPVFTEEYSVLCT